MGFLKGEKRMFPTKIHNHMTPEYPQGGFLGIAIDSFLTDRKAGGCAKSTLAFYAMHLRGYLAHCESQAVTQIEEINPEFLRRYLRAIETLARVRKLARNTPALQVNIATDGGQQVNAINEVAK